MSAVTACIQRHAQEAARQINNPQTKRRDRDVLRYEVTPSSYYIKVYLYNFSVSVTEAMEQKTARGSKHISQALSELSGRGVGDGRSLTAMHS